MPDEKDDVNATATTSSPKAAVGQSWLDLDASELQAIIDSNEVPDGLLWDNLQDHPQFDRLFRLRNSPAKLAQFLLDEKACTSPQPRPARKVTYVPALPLSYRMDRLALKRDEVRVQKEKLKNASVLFDRVVTIDDRVKAIEKRLEVSLKLIIELLREIETRVRPVRR